MCYARGCSHDETAKAPAFDLGRVTGVALLSYEKLAHPQVVLRRTDV